MSCLNKNTKSENLILVIDDNEAIHDDFRKILTNARVNEKYDELDAGIFGETQTHEVQLPEFDVRFANQGKQGLQLIKEAVERGEPFDLAFVDVRMPPGWDGVETATEILKIDPNIQIVFCTAYSDYATEDILSHFGLAENIMTLRKHSNLQKLVCLPFH